MRWGVPLAVVGIGVESDHMLQWVIRARGPKMSSRGNGETGWMRQEQHPSLLYYIPVSCPLCP